MKMIKLIIGVTFLTLFSMNALALKTITLDLNTSNPAFDVVLPANPSTGYYWSVRSYDDELFEMISSDYIPPEAERFGAGGEMIYRFQLKAGKKYPENTKILFKYARRWDPRTPTFTRVVINFKEVGKDN